MFTTFRRKVLPLFAVAGLFVMGSAPAWGAAGDQARTKIQNAQQTAASAEAKIKEIVRDIANAGSQQAITELNRQLKAYEKQKADALFAIYQGREELRTLENKHAQMKADIATFIRSVQEFSTQKSQLQSEMASHNRDAEAQRSAVIAFNSLPANQRSQAEANRLNAWRDRVNSRASGLNSRKSSLESRRYELIRWESTLKSRAAQLER